MMKTKYSVLFALLLTSAFPWNAKADSPGPGGGPPPLTTFTYKYLYPQISKGYKYWQWRHAGLTLHKNKQLRVSFFLSFDLWVKGRVSTLVHLQHLIFQEDSQRLSCQSK